MFTRQTQASQDMGEERGVIKDKGNTTVQASSEQQICGDSNNLCCEKTGVILLVLVGLMAVASWLSDEIEMDFKISID